MTKSIAQSISQTPDPRPQTRLLACAAALICSAAFGGEVARENLLGPRVDVTLQNGESRKGQLLAFADGRLKLKLDSREEVTLNGAAVLSVKFVAPEPPGPVLTAQNTQLAMFENRKLAEFRREDRLKTLSKEEDEEFKKLLAKNEIHIGAIQRELPKAATPEEASNLLYELGMSYLHQGKRLPEMKLLVKIAAEKIESETARKKALEGLPTAFTKIEGFIKPKKLP